MNLLICVHFTNSDGALIQSTPLAEFNDADSPIHCVAMDESGRLGTYFQYCNVQYDDAVHCASNGSFHVAKFECEFDILIAIL